jgi:hypothetical protein
VFLWHWKSYKNTRFFYCSKGDGIGGVVDDYAFSCMHGHRWGGQRQNFWNEKYFFEHALTYKDSKNRSAGRRPAKRFL